MTLRFALCSWLTFVALHATPLFASVKPSPLFTSHAVLPRDTAVPIWGTAAPGEAVTVTYAGQTLKTTADNTGNWSTTLAVLPAGLRGTLVIQGENRLEFSDVVTGDVWLCSGQSNMGFNVSGVTRADTEIAEADIPEIRHFWVPPTPSSTPDNGHVPDGSWNPATPGSVAHFTAVGYFFARGLQRELGVPIGLINTSWGGTPIAPWIPAAALRRYTGFNRLLAAKSAELAAWPARLARIESEQRAWEIAVAENQPILPPKPWNPGPPDSGQYMPSQLYQGMVLPFTRFPVRGVLWYQGEANADAGLEGARDYTELQNLLISGWREAWGRPDLPFLFVQLPNWGNPGDSTRTSWAWFREGQANTLANVPHTAMAVAIDVGDSDNIHPTDKQPVGHRLAQLALSEVYGKNVIARAPAPLSASPGPDGTTLEIRFTNSPASRLVFNAPAAGDSRIAFELAGSDGVFAPAEAHLADESTVVVTSASIPRPLTARYAWRNDPQALLFDATGLPVAPFRTDYLPATVPTTPSR